MARRYKKTGSVEKRDKIGNVTLYAKRLQDGRDSLYLMIYSPEPGTKKKYRYQFLSDLYLTGDRRRDDETLALATERMRVVYEDERGMKYGMADGFSPSKAKGNFLSLFDEMAAENVGTARIWRSVGIQLRGYTQSDIVQFSDITPRWLDGFVLYLRERIKRSTTHTYVSIVKRVVRRAVRDGFMRSNPAERMMQVRYEQAPRAYLTMADVRTLIDTPCKREDIKNAFLFACFTGLRVSDVRGLKWSNVHDNTLNLVQQKTKKHLIVPLSEMALSFMPARTGEYVFILPSHPYISRVLTEWSKAAGITKRMTFHTSRHTYATMLLNSGAGIKTVADLIGDTIDQTEVYARMLDATKRDAVDRLSDAFKTT